MSLPTKEECISILKKNKLPKRTIAHCKAVCDVALEIADDLQKKGIEVDKELVLAGALLHDVRRFDKDHIKSGAEFLEKMGFSKLARVIKTHGIWESDNKELRPKTTEEKIVFYADKRVIEGKKVTLEERFKYLQEKYGLKDKWYPCMKKIEKELLG